uniref:Glutamine amidotransferase type-1 domain-containing protein n=1 Tax=Steinernema glaseri TaxID=37863 RepID=A0A1I7ZC34_9BILA
MLAGFETFDVTMTDIMEDSTILEQFNGIAFVGGFSYADVFGSSKGWASAIRFNPKVLEAFTAFKSRPDTFSFGVCNGCQLMGLLGWIGAKNEEPQVFLDENACGRFQSGFATVRIEKNPAVMLQGMEGALLGVWTQHGEGRFTYRTPTFLEELKKDNLICVRFTDGSGEPSMLYPENPNGSEYSVAGLCSEDGRHLAMMPHPDRSFLSWQWPNYPSSLGTDGASTSPWIKMFVNAYEWLDSLKN